MPKEKIVKFPTSDGFVSFKVRKRIHGDYCEKCGCPLDICCGQRLQKENKKLKEKDRQWIKDFDKYEKEKVREIAFLEQRIQELEALEKYSTCNKDLPCLLAEFLEQNWFSLGYDHLEGNKLSRECERLAREFLKTKKAKKT